MVPVFKIIDSGANGRANCQKVGERVMKSSVWNRIQNANATIAQTIGKKMEMNWYHPHFTQ